MNLAMNFALFIDSGVSFSIFAASSGHSDFILGLILELGTFGIFKIFQ